MSEFLGKSRVEEADLDKYYPSLRKYFPMLAKFYTENQRMRIILPLDYDTAEKFKNAVAKKYGKVTPVTVHDAALDAIKSWIS